MTQTIYEGSTYSENNPDWHEEDSEWKANHIKNIILKNGISAETICEVGCGAGRILVELKSNFQKTRFSGYEISPYAFEKAKEREDETVKFHLGDFNETEKEYFDIVLIIDVIEHVEDYIGFARKLKSSGKYKIFHIPLDISAQSVTRASKIMMQRESVGHIHYFFKDTAIATLKDCGYKILDYHYTASRLELPNQTYTSKLMAWPRRFLFWLAPDLAVRVVGGFSLLVLAE